MADPDIDEIGWFWRPGHDDERVPGRLTLDADGSRVELLGAIPGAEISPKTHPRGLDAYRYPVVHCVLRGGRYFTLCGVVGWKFGSFRIPTVVYGDELPGDEHLDMKVAYSIADTLLADEPDLVSLRFRCEGLDPMLGRFRGVVPLRPIDGVGYVPKYFPPLEPQTIPVGTWQLDSETTTRGIDEAAVYTIRSDRPRPLRDYWSEVLEPLTWLARFCTQAAAAPLALEVELDLADEDDGTGRKTLVCNNISRLPADPEERVHGPVFGAASFVAPEDRVTRGTTEEIHAATDPVRARLVAAWIAWFRGSQVHGEIARTALHPTLLPGRPGQDERFRSAMGALELLSRAVVGSNEDPEEAIRREALSRSLEDAPPELRAMLGSNSQTIAWAARTLRDRRAKGQRRQLAELLEKYSNVLQSALRNKQDGGVPTDARAVAATLISRRGRLSHGSGSIGDDWTTYRWEVLQARAIVLGLLLAEAFGPDYNDRIAEIVRFCLAE